MEDSKTVLPALRVIYRVKNAAAGEAALSDFETGPWRQRYPAITLSWRRA
jgi:putative transposase